jgi:CD63 antigen
MFDCWQKLVLVINLLLFIVGLAITGVGIYLQVEMAEYFDLLGDIKINSATIIIIIGCIVTIITFFGFCGACMKSPCMMKTFAGSIIVILLIEAVLVIVIYVHKDDIKDQMKNALKNYNTDDKDGVTKVWDKLQQNYECCGVENSHDWFIFKFNNTSTPDAIPDSCCKEEKPGCGKDALKNPDDTDFYSKGCFEKLALDTTAAGIIGGLLLAIQLLAILVACCMARGMKENGGYSPPEEGLPM